MIGRRTSHDLKNGREIVLRYTITREKRPLNLRCDGGMKPTKVHASIGLLAMTL